MQTVRVMIAVTIVAVTSLALGVSGAVASSEAAVSGWAQGTATEPSGSSWTSGNWAIAGDFELGGIGTGTYEGRRRYKPAFERCLGAPYCYSVAGTVTFTTSDGSLVARIEQATSNMQDWPNALSDLTHDLNLTVVRGTGAFSGVTGTLNWIFTALPSTSTYWCSVLPTCPGGTPGLWYDGNPFVGGAGETVLDGDLELP